MKKMNFKRHLGLRLLLFLLSVVNFQKSFSVGNIFSNSFYNYVSTILNTDKDIIKTSFENAEKCLGECVKDCLTSENCSLYSMDKTWLQNEYILNFDFEFYNNNFLREFSIMRINYRVSMIESFNNQQKTDELELAELYRICYYELCKKLRLHLNLPFGINYMQHYSMMLEGVLSKNRKQAGEILKNITSADNLQRYGHTQLTAYQQLHLQYIIDENELFDRYL